MISLEELYEIIETLKKSEKRYIKLLCSTQDLKSASKLMDLAENSLNVNEFRELFEKTTEFKQPDIETLYNQILKSERGFYSQTIGGFRLRDDIQNLNILFQKAQYKQCQKMLKSTKDDAYKLEEFNYILELITIEIKLINRFYKLDEIKEIELKLLNEQKHIIEKEMRLSECYSLYSKARQTNNLKSEPEKINAASALLSSPLLHNQHDFYSIKAEFLILCATLICADYNTAANIEKTALKAIDLCKDHLFLPVEMPRQALDVHYKLIQYYIKNKQFEKAHYFTQLIPHIFGNKQEHGIDISYKQKSYYAALNLLLLTYSDINVDEQTIIHSVNELINGNFLGFEDKSTLIYSLIVYYMYNQNFLEAKKLIEKHTSFFKEDDKKDFLNELRLLDLITSIELADFSNAKTTVNLLKKVNHNFNEHTQLFLNHFNILMNDSKDFFDKSKYTEIYSTLKKLSPVTIDFSTFNLTAYTAYKTDIGKLIHLVKA
ncbi:MAG: hypothetical protein JSU07_06725 [Bacteroidetes bacterium]|nr:hypothetical protein [Bacteroidota bacterium]